MKLDRRKFIAASAITVAGSLIDRAASQTKGAKNGKQLRARSLKLNDDKVEALLSRMTLEEKIGQMIQAEQNVLKDPGDIEKYSLGSVLSGGSSDPKSGNHVGDWTDLYDSLQSRAMKTRLGIPILFGIDGVHGHSNVIDAVIFPHNIGLGCTRNSTLVERAARVTAEEIRATGINWTFAPCVTVPRDERWGRTYEGFGEAPELAATLGEAAVRGLQRNDLSNPLSVLACAKHFVGDGGTTYGTASFPNPQGKRVLDQGDAQLS